MAYKREVGVFLLIGIINTIVGLSSIFIFFHAAGLNYWLSTFLGNGIGMFVSYFLNRMFTFKNKGKISKTMIKFFIVVFLCYYLSYWVGSMISKSLFTYLPLPLPNRAGGDISILLGSGFYTITNFFGQKHVVFNEKLNLGYEGLIKIILNKKCKNEKVS